MSSMKCLNYTGCLLNHECIIELNTKKFEQLESSNILALIAVKVTQRMSFKKCNPIQFSIFM